MENWEDNSLERIENIEGKGNIEKALNWLEQNTDSLGGISVYGEMDSSRPNVNTLYVAWNGGYGKNDVLTIVYHNGLGDDQQIDSVELNDPSGVRDMVERFNIDGVPSVCSIDKLKEILESHLEN